jgi:hypothetical protein
VTQDGIPDVIQACMTLECKRQVTSLADTQGARGEDSWYRVEGLMCGKQLIWIQTFRPTGAWRLHAPLRGFEHEQYNTGFLRAFLK